jgi:hypothetical protein
MVKRSNHAARAEKTVRSENAIATASATIAAIENPASDAGNRRLKRALTNLPPALSRVIQGSIKAQRSADALKHFPVEKPVPRPPPQPVFDELGDLGDLPDLLAEDDGRSSDGSVVEPAEDTLDPLAPLDGATGDAVGDLAGDLGGGLAGESDGVFDSVDIDLPSLDAIVADAGGGDPAGLYGCEDEEGDDLFGDEGAPRRAPHSRATAAPSNPAKSRVVERWTPHTMPRPPPVYKNRAALDLLTRCIVDRRTGGESAGESGGGGAQPSHGRPNVAAYDFVVKDSNFFPFIARDVKHPINRGPGAAERDFYCRPMPAGRVCLWCTEGFEGCPIPVAHAYREASRGMGAMTKRFYFQGNSLRKVHNYADILQADRERFEQDEELENAGLAPAVPWSWWFEVSGAYCSPNCALAGAKATSHRTFSMTLFMLKRVYGVRSPDPTNPCLPSCAPPRELLAKYGGHMTIDQFRSLTANTQTDVNYTLVSAPFLPRHQGVLEVEKRRVHLATALATPEEIERAAQGMGAPDIVPTRLESAAGKTWDPRRRAQQQRRAQHPKRFYTSSAAADAAEGEPDRNGAKRKRAATQRRQPARRKRTANPAVSHWGNDAAPKSVEEQVRQCKERMVKEQAIIGRALAPQKPAKKRTLMSYMRVAKTKE